MSPQDLVRALMARRAASQLGQGAGRSSFIDQSGPQQPLLSGYGPQVGNDTTRRFGTMPQSLPPLPTATPQAAPVQSIPPLTQGFNPSDIQATSLQTAEPPLELRTDPVIVPATGTPANPSAINPIGAQGGIRDSIMRALVKQQRFGRQ